jgi:hypothetical protein
MPGSDPVPITLTEMRAVKRAVKAEGTTGVGHAPVSDLVLVSLATERSMMPYRPGEIQELARRLPPIQYLYVLPY